MKTPQQLLQQTLEVGACLLPDAASGGRTPYPAVFVHGLLGCSEVIPYNSCAFAT